MDQFISSNDLENTFAFLDNVYICAADQEDFDRCWNKFKPFPNIASLVTHKFSVLCLIHFLFYYYSLMFATLCDAQSFV